MSKITIKEVSQKVRVSDYLNYRDYLQFIYLQLKDQKEFYSYNEFSQELGFASSNVSWLYVTGRRNLTDATKAKVIKALGLKSKDRRYFDLLVEYNKARTSDKREQIFRKLIDLKNELTSSEAARKNLEYFSEWYHPVIREMIAMEDFEPDVSWIAARLQNRVLPNEIRNSLQLLMDLDLIRYDVKKNTYVQHGGLISPVREVGIMAAVRFHQKMIEIAKESVTRVPEKKREINALTLALSEKGFSDLGEKIIMLCEQAMDIEKNDPKKTDVFQLNIQLFPFTREK